MIRVLVTPFINISSTPFTSPSSIAAERFEDSQSFSNSSRSPLSFTVVKSAFSLRLHTNYIATSRTAASPLEETLLKAALDVDGVSSPVR